MWAEAGAAKAAAAVEYITDLVDQGRKVVAFYYHDPVQEGLLTGLAKANIEYTRHQRRGHRRRPHAGHR